MNEYNLNQTIDTLNGPPREQIIVNNYWAATALDLYHTNSTTVIEFVINGISNSAVLSWDSHFSKLTLKEGIDMANYGGVALSWFVMSVLLGYNYVEQSEIGDGVDYRFMKSEPDDNNLNFLEGYHYVEVSGILEESKTNTLAQRIRIKHNQIGRGSKRNEHSSVIVTLFSKPQTVKEAHK